MYPFLKLFMSSIWWLTKLSTSLGLDHKFPLWVAIPADMTAIPLRCAHHCQRLLAPWFIIQSTEVKLMFKWIQVIFIRTGQSVILGTTAAERNDLLSYSNRRRWPSDCVLITNFPFKTSILQSLCTEKTGTI